MPTPLNETELVKSGDYRAFADRFLKEASLCLAGHHTALVNRLAKAMQDVKDQAWADCKKQRLEHREF